ncbi:MAG TPA: response regulator [Stellaceae bacterium]|jgi:CheY-like chemotaxis protein
MRGAGRILVVDDDDDVREVLTEILEADGYDVVPVATSGEALSLLIQGEAADLLLTDVVLGRGLNGFELAQQAILVRPQLNVLYISGHTWGLEELHTMVPGSYLLRKPYRAIDLLTQVARLLKHDDAAVSGEPGINAPAPAENRPAAILVVEDDPRSHAIAVDLFAGLGLMVFDAWNAENGLALLKQHPEITVLFSDVRLPGMSGIELAEEARKLRPDLKIVLTSAYTDHVPHIERGLLPGLRFLPKPWQLADFTGIAASTTRH